MILNIRIDHKTADINKIEESTSTMEDIFAKIQKEHQVQEFIQLKTCNRAEIYLVMDESPLDYHWNGLVVEKDEKALEHVLKLSCGLESMIIGEDQILGQLKDAYKVSVKTGCCGQVLSTVFTKAIHVGQSVRKKTRINQGSVSIGSAAVNLAESVLGNLKCKKVLVIGAGKMGTLVAKALVEKHLQAIVVANRTYDRAVCLAKELGGSAIHFDSLSQAMSDADVVISATGAPHNILTQEKVSEAVPPEHLQTMVMIDIANPRDIEEEVAQLGVKLYNIDDLRGIADKNKKIRETEAKEAEKIIANELELLEKSLRHLEVEPVIAQIRAQAETIRTRETQKAFRKLGDMNGKEKVVDDLTKVVVDRVFLDIIHNLKEAAENNNKDVLNTAKYIFKNKN
ncbi:glutamyl-tRNA reductase [Methanobacterium sp. BAmetb5]|uniref:glutamyl-tRNA reductase n=1 Tax=Methanobacterium sp. BAmetb5 TaxID=2025351 RepID=UPI000E82B583|nr:glutamyl-tRNA reductase [Methanobacterium sp. BAmetb5]AXV39901.1 MAG: glutamyl-tRNA reductase [Methanobacterium sp. BAmetb5]